MSSPSFYHDNTPIQPPMMDVTDEADMGGLPKRLMRVKVLYTFDNANQANCLARLPSAAPIPVVALDEGTQIGVIELKTCLQAIVAASPELVAKLGQDYTVYAYDYSEYETPLVGQGMLSRALASASPTPLAPAHQSTTMITGRVQRNILGLFNNGIKETLEVKLKLVPVPTCLQNEYLDNVEKYRSASRMSMEGTDTTAWNDVQSMSASAIGTMGRDGRPSSQGGVSANHGGFESIHQMLTPNFSPEQEGRGGLQDMSQSRAAYGMQNTSYSVQGSRAASPAPSVGSIGPMQQIHTLPPRSASRNSTRSNTSKKARKPRARRSSFDAEEPLQMENEEGQARKRARISTTAWSGRSAFGEHEDSLRVVASTAASIRGFRPPGFEMSSAPGNGLEPPPRAPTPTPGDFNNPRLRSRPSASLLRQESTAENGGSYRSPYADAMPLPEIPSKFESAIDSADDDNGTSTDNSPQDFPSSPPVLMTRENTIIPSSPILPAFPYPTDSGFMSDPHFERTDDVEPIPHQAEIWAPQPVKRPHPSKDQSRRPWQVVQPGPSELLPQKLLPRPTRPARGEGAQLTRTASSPGPETKSRKLSLPGHLLPPKPEERARSLLSQTNPISSIIAREPPEPANQQVFSDAVEPSRLPNLQPRPADMVRTQSSVQPPSQIPKLSRSKTSSSESMQSQYPELGIQRSGSGARRKKAIDEKLQRALEAGEMPPFCANCGEIQTPNWRKAYSKEVDEQPEISTEKDGIIGFEEVKEEDGVTLTGKFRIFKRSLTNVDKNTGNWTCLQLCNPCGLWFGQKGIMRPPEIFMAGPRTKQTGKSKRGRPSRKKQQDEQAITQFDQVEEGPDTVEACIESPEETFQNLQQETSQGSDQQLNMEDHPDAPPRKRPRASSVHVQSTVERNRPQWDELTKAAALERAIQSSPARFMGSQASPIEVEEEGLTPKPVRRQLFPSPRKSGEVKRLDDAPSKPANSTADLFADFAESSTKPKAKDIPISLPLPTEDTTTFAATITEDKENLPPSLHDNDSDGLSHLFGEDVDGNFLSMTPKSTRSFLNFLRTPTPKTNRIRRVLSPRTSVNEALQNSIDHITTPSRSTRRTPNPNQWQGMADATPFTAHLNALLSDAPLASSPSGFGLQLHDFTLPNIGSPGADGRFEFNVEGFGHDNDFFSTDIVMPSSPPAPWQNTPGGGFKLWEDGDEMVAKGATTDFGKERVDGVGQDNEERKAVGQ